MDRASRTCIDWTPWAAATGTAALPVTVRILLENVLRHAGGGVVAEADVETLAAWRPGLPAEAEIPFMPARVVLQDFTGVPAVVDLAVMRDAMADLGGDPARVNPLVPADLVIDHSVQVDRFGTPASFAFNVEREYERNGERYQLLRWAQTAFRDLRVVPPGTGIVHQVNLEFLATVVEDRDGVAFPDTLVGTDSHTTMVNALGVLGYGVGGIEAEAVLLGQPLYQPMPHVVGVRLTGELPRGSTATDLVLVVTEMLRAHGVVGAFVEFAGDGLASLSLADRATISNMSPEFGATATLFPIDDETLAYLRLTGRTPERVDLVERYAKEQGLWRLPGAGPEFDESLTLDLSSVEPSVAGPRRPQDRVVLPGLPANFRSAFPNAAPSPETSEDLKRLTDEGGTTGATENGGVAIELDGEAAIIRHGSVAIAAITSCTNTSNPTVMVGAGLLARNAVARGLRVSPTVKTSLAPGSKAVTGYLEAAGLMDPLATLGFALAGYGCTTCIGNSGPLDAPDRRGRGGQRPGRGGGAVGQSQLRGAHPPAGPGELPRVAAARRGVRAGGPRRYRPHDASRSGSPTTGRRCSSPTSGRRPRRSARSSAARSTPSSSGGPTPSCSRATSAGGRCPIPTGDRYDWDTRSTYIAKPPYFDGLTFDPAAVTDLVRCARPGGPGRFGHDRPHQPGGLDRILVAGRRLAPGAQRRAARVQLVRRPPWPPRGHDARHVRQHPAAQPAGARQGGAVHGPPPGRASSSSSTTPRCATSGRARRCSSSRARSTAPARRATGRPRARCSLGVRAVLAESYERIHRSNLVGMGVLPLQFKPGDSAASLGLTGRETFSVTGLADGLSPRTSVRVVAERDVAAGGDGSEVRFEAIARLDGPIEVDYYRQGGILPAVLRRLARES